MSFGKFKEQRGAAESSGDAAQNSSKMHEFVKAQGDSGAKTYLSKGSKIAGQINFDGPAEIDGELEGEVHSKAQLIIGRSAVVKAKILGQDVLVMGTVRGDIQAAVRLALKQPAEVVGNISAPILSIEEGVLFQGNCRMEAKPEQQRE